jgi:hypothetical protein
MSRARGLDLQNALARYLATWWPHAESAGAGRGGTDILGTPGIVWENKTARKFSPLEFCRQARRHAMSLTATRPVKVPVVVYWPPGIGEGSAGSAIAMMPLSELVHLLLEAGYGGEREDMADEARTQAALGMEEK